MITAVLGAPGSGKSAVGRALSRRDGCLDLDLFRDLMECRPELFRGSYSLWISSPLTPWASRCRTTPPGGHIV
jgi:hypothetical protein